MPQSLVKIIVHVVFSTKDRINLITPEVESELFDYISGIITGNGSRLITANGTANYGAFSIGQSQIADVSEYIRNQKAHHVRKQLSYEDEFRNLCRKYDVEIDERYCWD